MGTHLNLAERTVVLCVAVVDALVDRAGNRLVGIAVAVHKNVLLFCCSVSMAGFKGDMQEEHKSLMGGLKYATSATLF